MPQGYAIELYFDTALENQVLKAWNILARRKISTKLIEIESRPHITLLSTNLTNPMKLENILQNLASKHEPIPVCLSSIGTLLNDRNVIFYAPTPSLSLLQFHSNFCDALEKEEIEMGEDYNFWDALENEKIEIGEEYMPDSWLPYCSVAEEMPNTRMAECLSLLRELKSPVTGYITDIGLVEFSPVRAWFSFELGSSMESKNM